VDNDHRSNIALPFFHLAGDKFWQLMPNPGFEATIQTGVKLRSLSCGIYRGSKFPNLKALIEKSLREVLREERLHLCRLLMPFVSNEKQAEIEAQFVSPEDFDAAETVDLTDWVKHGD
jgi:hypothetical protein